MNYRKSNPLLKWWRSVDQQIVIALAMLFCFSLILVTTSGVMIAARIGLDEHYFAHRQPIYLLIAAIVIVCISSLEQKQIKRLAILGFIVSLLLLILVKFCGYEVKGAVRWINIGGVSAQPSEFIKPLFAVVVGWLLSLKFEEDFPGFSVSMVLYIAVTILLILQPDFGMVVMITAVFSIQLFIAGIPIFWVICIFAISIIGILGAYTFLPHVANRINSFLDPENSENYQISKSIKAFEHGGFYGRGPGEGAIKQTLPDSHTDFIFAVAGEEFGAITCLAMVAVFAFIVIRSFYKLMFIEDKFVQLASAGIISQFALQSIINIGVTLNVFPTKGMTLPFISYGGSSTIAISIGMGIVLGLTKRAISTTYVPKVPDIYTR